MGTISPATVSDGETIDASDLNNPINTIADEINGNLDANNLADDAVSTAKIQDGAVTNAKLSTTAGELGSAWQSYTTNVVGFSGTPTDECAYTQIGKTVILRVYFSGTSNTTNLSFDLPVTAANIFNEMSSGLATNNGTQDSSPARIYTNTTTTAVATRNAGTSNWSSSGTKGLRAIFIYEAA